MSRPPEGWAAVEAEETTIWAPDDALDALRALGLERPWELVSTREAGPGTGRGGTARLVTSSGEGLFVKQYLRGGLLARFNRDRYFSLERFWRELDVGRRARAAGLPLGEVFALVLQPARPGWRAWGVAREIAGGVDLARLLEGAAGEEAACLWRGALETLKRMGDAGLQHPDLNLGNLVGVRAEEARWLFHVVDLDRARFTGRPLPLEARHAMLARLERSWSKIFGAEGRLPSARRLEIVQQSGAP